MSDSADPQTTPESRSDHPTGLQALAIGASLIGVASALGYGLIRLWPVSQSPPDFVALGITFSMEIRTLALVLFAGGLGSFVHAATSFGDYVGNRTLSTRWFWWYVLRLPIGMALALVIYVVVRGGLFVPGTGSQTFTNMFGVAAMAFLSGMFSKQATDKLDEVFKAMFKTAPSGGDAQREDKLKPPQGAAVPPAPGRVVPVERLS